ncbi:helix-turn-helix domain-containing protein [Undibacterium sp. RuRC25W]|uniref:helix-turn-helix transcriptional regulator n=1 Tax=Undibacterium sp. RuRC25W TaxID=3413047 RepID=UPI003BF14F4C
MTHSRFDSIASLLSVQDAIFPAHPFSGLLAIAREQNWRLTDLFPAFAESCIEFGANSHNTRISYVQAREGLLRARQIGGDELCLWSGARKSLPQLGQMAIGMAAQPTLLKALQFGLEFQLIAGSMVHLQFVMGTPYSALVAHSLFDDIELQDFLAVDHLLTAVNAARQLGGAHFRLHQVELRGQNPLKRALFEQVFGCPVVIGADTNRLLIPNEVLDLRLSTPDAHAVHAAHNACEQELAAVGVLGRQSLLRTLVSQQCELHTVEEMSAALGISPRSLQRLLVREGTSYFQVTETVRLDRAKRLLLTTLSLENIAEQLGYSDARSFRRAFNRWTNCSPADYRLKVTAAP